MTISQFHHLDDDELAALSDIDAILQAELSDPDDFYWPTRHRALSRGSVFRAGLRNGVPAVSRRLVIEQAAVRYFWMMEAARKGLSGKFTLEDFHVMLNTECSTVWQRSQADSMLSFVAEKSGSVDSSLRARLKRLTTVQDEALLDVCECIWRHGCDVEVALKALGMELQA